MFKWFAVGLLLLPLSRLERSSASEPTSPVFVESEPGHFSFDTGVVRGRMRADGKNQGIIELVDRSTGTNLVHGVGAMSLYRVFSDGKRYGDAARNWPATGRVAKNGAVEIDYPATADRPLRLRVAFHWTSADALDVTIQLTPGEPLKDVEVFLSSYFVPTMRAFAYVAPNQFESGPATLMAADVNPLIDGTYLMFPRDRRAVQLIYDGRWELPPHPVRWSITRMMAAPLTVRRDESSGSVVAMMSRSEDCFATAMPYNKDPPDGPSSHASLYHSLFGQDVERGETLTSTSRLVILNGATDEQIIARYSKFLSETDAGKTGK